MVNFVIAVHDQILQFLYRPLEVQLYSKTFKFEIFLFIVLFIVIIFILLTKEIDSIII